MLKPKLAIPGGVFTVPVPPPVILPAGGVGVGVLVGVFVGVLVGVSVGVLVGVFVGVSVGGTGVSVGVLVGVSVGGTGVSVGVFVGVGVLVGCEVGVTVEHSSDAVAGPLAAAGIASFLPPAKAETTMAAPTTVVSATATIASRREDRLIPQAQPSLLERSKSSRIRLSPFRRG